MDDVDAQIHELDDCLVRIELPPVAGIPTALGGNTNVFLIEGPSPALINAGHPTQTDELVRALRARHISPADIERIVATSWRIDVLGGATRFPQADLFLFSPDMQQPVDYEAHIDRVRTRWSDAAETVTGAVDDLEVDAIESCIDSFYPPTSRDLRFAPLRDGHFVCAGPIQMEVVATAGPGAGHAALYAADEQLLFCGDFQMSGLPDRIDDAQGYIVGLERLAELPSKRVLPNRGRTYKQGRWTVNRAVNFLNNFLSNAPAALVRQPTILEFLRRDRGGLPDDPMELVVTCERFRALLDELVRTRTIAADGDGIQRRYGVDVEDPRQKVRDYPPGSDSAPSPDSTP